MDDIISCEKKMWCETSGKTVLMQISTAKIIKNLKKFNSKISKDAFTKRLINIGLPNFNTDIKKAAVVYLTSPFLETWAHPRPNETNIKSIVGTLVSKNYLVDIYDFDYAGGFNANEIAPYDLIFGFGPCFDKLSRCFPFAKKIMYAVEMPPWHMLQAEQHAITEMRDLGIKVHSGSLRSYIYYTDENFLSPDKIIAMGSSFNKAEIQKKYSGPVELIDCSVPTEILKYKNDVPKSNNSFAWIGSNGATMKGLHIILKLFEELPEFQLHLFGLNKIDEKILKVFPTKNIINHGFRDLRDLQFQNLIAEQAAVISASYSEGMQTSIATALSLGTKAIVTQQCGYYLNDTGVAVSNHNDLKLTLHDYINKKAFKMEPADVLTIRKRYSAENFQNNISNLLG